MLFFAHVEELIHLLGFEGIGSAKFDIRKVFSDGTHIACRYSSLEMGESPVWSWGKPLL